MNTQRAHTRKPHKSYCVTLTESNHPQDIRSLCRMFCSASQRKASKPFPSFLHMNVRIVAHQMHVYKSMLWGLSGDKTYDQWCHEPGLGNSHSGLEVANGRISPIRPISRKSQLRKFLARSERAVAKFRITVRTAPSYPHDRILRFCSDVRVRLPPLLSFFMNHEFIEDFIGLHK